MLPLIYIVEDDPTLRQALLQRFGEERCLVGSADSGPGALALLRERVPDLVILDLMLPGSDGVSVLEEARQLPGYSQVPFIVLSNLAVPEVIEGCLKFPPVRFLEKVATELDELVATVWAMLGEQR